MHRAVNSRHRIVPTGASLCEKWVELKLSWEVGARDAMRHWRFVMLPWLVTFHLTRLGFEAQNAAAFRFLRLVRNAGQTEADDIISDTIAPPRDSHPAAIKLIAERASLDEQGLQKTSARKQAQKSTLTITNALDASWA
jgi:hypothetical protein